MPQRADLLDVEPLLFKLAQIREGGGEGDLQRAHLPFGRLQLRREKETPRVRALLGCVHSLNLGGLMREASILQCILKPLCTSLVGWYIAFNEAVRIVLDPLPTKQIRSNPTFEASNPNLTHRYILTMADPFSVKTSQRDDDLIPLEHPSFSRCFVPLSDLGILSYGIR